MGRETDWSRGGVTIGDGAVIGAGSVITKNIPPASVALGVPARVVQDLNVVGVGIADFSATVNTLTEAMMFNRQLDRKEEVELARLNTCLVTLQQKKCVSLQQKSNGVALQSDRQPEERRGSEPGSPTVPRSGSVFRSTLFTGLIGGVFVLGTMFGFFLLQALVRYAFGVGYPQI